MNAEEVITVVGYIEESFGGYAMDDDQKRPYLRALREYTMIEAIDAVDEMMRRWNGGRRPPAAQMCAVIRAQRPRETGITPTTVDPAKLAANYGTPQGPWPPGGTTPAHASAHFQAARAVAAERSTSRQEATR